MIGKLYTITNKINNKKYVGKTYFSLDKRWKEHTRDSKKFSNRPLYRAFNKYGIENFQIDLISELEESLLESAEIELIAKLDTFKSGYNATKGGDGTRYLKISDEEIINTYLQCGKNGKETSRILGIDYGTVKTVLNNNGFNPNHINSGISKRVYISDPYMEFDSCSELARQLIASDCTNGLLTSVSSKVARAAKGEIPSYLGFNIKYMDQ